MAKIINGKTYVFVQYFRNKKDAEYYVKKEVRGGHYLDRLHGKYSGGRRYKILPTDSKKGWNVWIQRGY